MLASSSARDAGAAFERSFAFMEDQTYSAGLSSGAYAGKRSTVSQFDCVARNAFVAFERCAVSPSQNSRRRRLLMWRLRFLIYAITSSEVTADGRIMKKSRGYDPSASDTIIPMTDRVFHPPAEAITGVFPFLAHVRLTVGRSETPDSSKNPRRRLFLSPFFGDSGMSP